MAKSLSEPSDPSDGASGPEARLGVGFKRVYRLVGDLVVVMTVATVVVTAFFLALLHGYGERHWLLAILLYIPSITWILPSLSLLPLCVVFRFRYAVFLTAFFLVHVWLSMGFQWGGQEDGDAAKAVTLVSNNVGNNGKTTVDRFAEEHGAGILLFQEAARAAYYRDKYPGWTLAVKGEFALATRFTVKESDFLAEPTWGIVPVAARYVIEVEPGVDLVVYNVHLPTRRFIMNGLRGMGLASAVVGRSGGYGGQIRSQNRDFFEGQIRLTEALIARAQKESLPVIMMGDFNIPARGYLYGLLSDTFQDAFVEAGSGFGYTFPGQTHNPLALFRPWLRIDHAFVGPKIKVIAAEVEADRPSQHRGIAVSLQLP